MEKALDKVMERADYAARQAVTDGGHLIERNAKLLAPVARGTLRRSIHVDSVLPLGPGRWESNTGPSMVYSRLREKGGTIKPGAKGVLAWVTSGARPTSPAGWAAANQAGIARYSMSPIDQKGEPYMRPAFDSSVSAVYDIYRLAFRKAFEGDVV